MDHQHRHRGSAHQTRGRRALKPSVHAADVSTPHHNQVRAVLLCDLLDGFFGHSFDHADDHFYAGFFAGLSLALQMFF